jgi:hypothetical protein
LRTGVERKSTSQFVTENAINIVAVALMIILFAQYYVEGGVPWILDISNAFVRGMPWIAFITTILLMRAVIVETQQRERGWWHNIGLIIAFFGSMVMYEFTPAAYTDLYYYVGTTGVIALSSISGWHMVLGAYDKLKLRGVFQVVILILIVIGVLPFTPINDLLPRFISDFTAWAMTTLTAGSVSGQNAMASFAWAALFFRTLLLIEKIRPKGT